MYVLIFEPFRLQGSCTNLILFRSTVFPCFDVMRRSRTQTSPPVSSSSAVTNGATRMQQLIDARQNARRALISSMTWVKSHPREKLQSASKPSLSSADLQGLIKQIHNDWHKSTLSTLHQFLEAVSNVINFAVSLCRA